MRICRHPPSAAWTADRFTIPHARRNLCDTITGKGVRPKLARMVQTKGAAKPTGDECAHFYVWQSFRNADAAGTTATEIPGGSTNGGATDVNIASLEWTTSLWEQIQYLQFVTGMQLGARDGSCRATPSWKPGPHCHCFHVTRNRDDVKNRLL